jgi:hypothetical protein
MDDLVLASKRKRKVAADGAVDDRTTLFTAYSPFAKTFA